MMIKWSIPVVAAFAFAVMLPVEAPPKVAESGNDRASSPTIQRFRCNTR